MTTPSSRSKRTTPPAARPAPLSRRPRSVDKIRSDAILQATLGVLAESGYDGMTVDEVARRAAVSKATLYRRWSSREELVVDAVRSMNPGIRFPDTGSFRGDLAAGVNEFLQNDDHIRVVVGIASALPRYPELRQVLEEFLSDQSDNSYSVYRRAVERDEIADDRQAGRLTAVLRGVLLNELLFARGKINKKFVLEIVDEVIVPLATAR